MVARTEQDYLAAMKAALPQGPAFPREGTPTLDAVLSGAATELAAEDALTSVLLTEGDPISTNVLLPEWEADYGLPDCPDHAPESLQDRKAALLEKYRRVGGWNPRKITALCLALGYEVTVVEYRPFVGGVSRGGQIVGGPHTCRHWMKVRVHGPRVTYFRGGVSRGGERQLSLTRAEDLECLIDQIKQAHQELTIAYEGV